MTSICKSIIPKRPLAGSSVLSLFTMTLIAAAPLNAAVISIDETIITNAIPEPGGAGLILVSAGVFAFICRGMRPTPLA